MKIGELKRVISIQAKTKTPEDIGSWSETWAEFAKTRAMILTVSASEQVKNQQIENQITHKITIRYQAGIVPEMRVVYNSRIFEIIGQPINIKEENRWLDLLCVESS